MEMELIERLRKKQSEQLNALGELEGVLGVPARASMARSSSAQSVRSATGKSRQGAARAQPPASTSATQRAPPPPSRLAQPAAPRHVQQPEPVASTSPYSPPAGDAGAADGGEPGEEDIARAFSMYDVEGTGLMPTDALSDLMSILGVPLTAVQLEQAVLQLDRGNAGTISFGEFLYWWKG